MVFSKAPEGCPPLDPLGAAGWPCGAPLGEALPLDPITPVAGAPCGIVAAPAGRLFAGSGALCPELGLGGDCVAPVWANAVPAISMVAAKAVRTVLRKMVCPQCVSDTGSDHRRIGAGRPVQEQLTNQAPNGSPTFGYHAKNIGWVWLRISRLAWVSMKRAAWLSKQNDAA